MASMPYHLAEPTRGMYMQVARFEGCVIDIARVAVQGDVEQLVQHVAQSLTQEAGAALTQVWAHDDVSTRLRLRASSGMIAPPPGEQDEFHLQQAPPLFWVETVVGTRQPLIQNDLVDDARFDQKWVVGEKIAGVAAVPIIYAGHLYGALIVLSQDEVAPETADLTKAIASITAMAMYASQLSLIHI